MLTAPTTGDSDEVYGAACTISTPLKWLYHSQRYQSRRSRSCIVDNWKLHDSIHHLKSSFFKKNLFHQFTFSLVPEVRAFFSGNTEAAISEKGNDGKFDAVSSLSMCNNASVLTRTTLNNFVFCVCKNLYVSHCYQCRVITGIGIDCGSDHSPWMDGWMDAHYGLWAWVYKKEYLSKI